MDYEFFNGRIIKEVQRDGDPEITFSDVQFANDGLTSNTFINMYKSMEKSKMHFVNNATPISFADMQMSRADFGNLCTLNMNRGISDLGDISRADQPHKIVIELYSESCDIVLHGEIYFNIDNNISQGDEEIITIEHLEFMVTQGYMEPIRMVIKPLTE